MKRSFDLIRNNFNHLFGFQNPQSDSVFYHNDGRAVGIKESRGFVEASSFKEIKKSRFYSDKKRPYLINTTGTKIWLDGSLYGRPDGKPNYISSSGGFRYYLGQNTLYLILGTEWKRCTLFGKPIISRDQIFDGFRIKKEFQG